MTRNEHLPFHHQCPSAGGPGALLALQGARHRGIGDHCRRVVVWRGKGGFCTESPCVRGAPAPAGSRGCRSRSGILLRCNMRRPGASRTTDGPFGPSNRLAGAAAWPAPPYEQCAQVLAPDRTLVRELGARRSRDAPVTLCVRRTRRLSGRLAMHAGSGGDPALDARGPDHRASRPGLMRLGNGNGACVAPPGGARRIHEVQRPARSHESTYDLGRCPLTRPRESPLRIGRHGIDRLG
jgi:hypothetical protein